MTPQTLLYRQIHHTWVNGEGVTTQAFKPTSKDNKKLSTYDGDLFTAKSSYEHFTIDGRTSIGVLGLTNQEFASEDLTCERDDNQFVGHVSVDYSAYSRGEIEKKSKKLRDIAHQRSWLYTPNTPKEEIEIKVEIEPAKDVI